MLPPERRLHRVLELIEDRKYFTLHADRQTGKTTSLMWLEHHLNATGCVRALWADLQPAGGQPDPALAFRTVLGLFEGDLSRRHADLARPGQGALDELLHDPATAILEYLTRLSELDPRPLVVLFDEADGLVGQAMVSLLTQLRTGYIARSGRAFPASIALVGQRQVRDFVLTAEEHHAADILGVQRSAGQSGSAPGPIAWLGTTSPFNVTVEAATLGPINEEEVAELLGQHTAITGQRFDPAAIRRIHALGQGHPWLTNALADPIVGRDVRDRSVPITEAHVDAAKETLLLERRSHIDSLVARLREPRVRRIIEPMLVGGRLPADLLDDDLSYVVGLGVVTVRHGFVEIANPIYREVIPRALTYVQQVSIAEEPAWYIRPDDGLDVEKLMRAFQTFWRKDGHLAAEGFAYREAGPHLMLMAFLQRIVNGGGRIEREVGLGRGALDMMIFWRSERHAIEVKLRRDTETEAEALEQVASYLDRAGLAEEWLILFDLRKELPWSEKLTLRELACAGKRVHVVDC